MGITGLGEVAERVRRYTVLVQPGGRGSGSGVICGSDGVVITNAHVVRDSRVGVTLWDGREFTAEVTARDSCRDLASLRIHAADLSPAVIADSSRVRPGEMAIAVGNPLGFLGAMTMGVVQAVGPLRGLGPKPWVQADVRLAPGNSGGPLADVHGQVIGINTMVAGGLALSIPSNEVSRFLSGDAGRHPLGVTVTPVRLPRSSASRFGLAVLAIRPESPAAVASLLPGDILVGTDTIDFSAVEDIAEPLRRNPSGILRLKFLRGDYRKIRRVSISLNNTGRGSVAA